MVLKQTIKLAFRNLWRNKRRTIITSGSILFAVFFAIAISSIQEGTWDHMIKNVVNTHLGYIQIHQNGFWNDRSIDKTTLRKPLWDSIKMEDPIKQLVPRIESFALASYGDQTKGALIIGVAPESENNLTQLSEKIIRGEYLTEDSEAILMGEGLADYLNVDVDDTLVLISQGYHGVNAAGKYPVGGILKFPTPELSKQVVYMNLERAQYFYGTEDRITSAVVSIQGEEDMGEVVALLENQLDTSVYEIMTYEEMMPDLVQAKEVDGAGSQIILLILYLIIGFGIFGTILMMVKERQYELGVLKALGMKSGELNQMIWLEVMLLGLLGCVAGMLVAFPIVYYFYKNPIVLTGDMAGAYEKFGVEPLLPAALDGSIFLGQTLVVFFMITILAVYPMLKIKKMKPVEAMRA